MIFLDTNVIADVLDDGAFADQSSDAIERAADAHDLAIGHVVLAELFAGPRAQQVVPTAIAKLNLRVVALDGDAAERAGRAFREYRKRGGERNRMIPDFLVGAQAAVRGAALITRDGTRFASYFPELQIIDPGADLA